MRTLKATPPTLVLARSSNATAWHLAPGKLDTLRGQSERKALRIYPTGQEV